MFLSLFYLLLFRARDGFFEQVKFSCIFYTIPSMLRCDQLHGGLVDTSILIHVKASYMDATETWTFGENACHPERSAGSGSPGAEILRCAQDDSQDSAQVLSREVFSPNV